jgi:putative transposase
MVLRPDHRIALQSGADTCRVCRAYPRGSHHFVGAAVRRARPNGVIKWGGDPIFISQALMGEPVATEENERGEWLVCYAHLELGFIDPNARLRRRKLSKPRRACGLVDNAARSRQGPQARQRQQEPTT